MLSIAPSLTVVMPVYNRAEYLDEAIESVLAQTSTSWRLLLADDHSRLDTWQRQRRYECDERILLHRQERNVGLFANLNSALSLVGTPFVLLLCSDDRLKPIAIERLLTTIAEFPDADLVLPCFDAIDAGGKSFPSAQDYVRRAMMASTGALEPRRAIELLLRFGSYNGNLTGMLFRTALQERVGPFRADWQHAADWEWIYRVAKKGTIVLSAERLVDVRVHPDQLSSSNSRSGHQAREVASVVRTLLVDLAGHPRARAWATHHMQHFAWAALRAAARGEWELVHQLLGEVSRTTGILPALTSLIAWMPTRVITRLRNAYAIPPD
jgi:glycosyltransferase involved in cell wall biosynthesis